MENQRKKYNIENQITFVHTLVLVFICEMFTL